MQQYPQQGYGPVMQQPMSQPLSPMQSQQELKFYKSAIFGFSSAAGKFERDARRMQSQGWRVASMAFLGTNFFWQRIVGVTYERP